MALPPKSTMSNQETHRYVGLTYVVKKEVGSHFRDEFFSRDYSVEPALLDNCNILEEKKYLRQRKKMMVLSKQTPREVTVLFDESDKLYSAVTFLYPSPDISEPEIACKFLSDIVRKASTDELLKSILEDSVFIFAGRYLFLGSKGEQEKLEFQDRHIKVRCRDLGSMEVIVDKMVHNKIPDHSCWKNIKSIHKIIADEQSQEALRFFYQERLRTLEEEVKSFKVEAPSLPMARFYQKWYLLQEKGSQIQHKKNITFIESELTQIKDGYESQSHLAIQHSLSKTQRHLVYVSILSFICTVVVIGAVGYFQISITKEIGSRQLEIETENLPDLQYHVSEPKEIPYDGSEVPLNILVSNPLHHPVDYCVEIVGEDIYVRIESSSRKSLDLSKEASIEESLEAIQTTNLKFLVKVENIWAPVGKTVRFRVTIRDLTRDLTVVNIQYSYMLEDVGVALGHEYVFILTGSEFLSS